MILSDRQTRSRAEAGVTWDSWHGHLARGAGTPAHRPWADEVSEADCRGVPRQHGQDVRASWAYIASVLIVGLVALACLSAAPVTEPATGPLFRTLRVLVDPHGKAMAVWQVEVVAEGDVKVVGVEKGEARGFSDPPYYDPAAMAGGRIVIGAYSLEKDLPAGRTHVATLHVRVGGPEKIKCRVRVMTAGTGDGSSIVAEATVEEGVQL